MFSWFEKRINPYPDSPLTQPPKSFFAFLWACTQGSRLYIALLILLSAGISAFEALLYSMLGNIVDWLSQIEPAHLWEQANDRLLWLGGIVIGSTLVVWLNSLVKYQALLGNFPMRLRWNFHRYLLSQSMQFFQDEFSGRVATKLMQTALAVRSTIFIVIEVIVFIIIYFCTMTAIVGHFDLLLVIPFFVWLCSYCTALWYFVPRLGKVGAQQADARSLMTGRITDAYSNIMTVKLFSHTHRETAYARSAMQEFIQSVYAQMRLGSSITIINHLLSMLLIVSTAGLALSLWTQNLVGIGAVAASTAMAMRLIGIAQWIMWEVSNLFENIGTVQDGINTLSQPITVQDRPDAKPLTIKQGSVILDNVSFSYGSQREVLHHLSLQIKPGEKIGLVGRSGAGKSTIVNLLLRFYDVETGQILIDGQDIASVTQDSLRAQIGMVTQDTSLLHRSVRENLTYGRPDATEEQIIAAAKQAEAHDFILQLSDAQGRHGYDAHVGERGVKLSGGQRQRIAIARVMLKDAPILLLDEATSALDSEVEAAIQGSLYRLMEGKTVVAIAHRLSTIAAMDKLIVLDSGIIVEEGSHTQLLANNGLYARLWAHQSGGFLPEECETC